MHTSSPSERGPVRVAEPRRSTARALAAVAVLAVASVSATACGSGKSGAAAPATSASGTASPTTAPTTATATATPISSSAPASEFPAAKTSWEQGSKADAADQGQYWQAAEKDLIASDNASYASAIADLKQLVALPDAMETPTQQAESHSDVAALDDFFGTPGLYED